jgi:hypothetical protein
MAKFFGYERELIDRLKLDVDPQGKKTSEDISRATTAVQETIACEAQRERKHREKDAVKAIRAQQRAHEGGALDRAGGKQIAWERDSVQRLDGAKTEFDLSKEAIEAILGITKAEATAGGGESVPRRSAAEGDFGRIAPRAPSDGQDKWLAREGSARSHKPWLSNRQAIIAVEQRTVARTETEMHQVREASGLKRDAGASQPLIVAQSPADLRSQPTRSAMQRLGLMSEAESRAGIKGREAVNAETATHEPLPQLERLGLEANGQRAREANLDRADRAGLPRLSHLAWQGERSGVAANRPDQHEPVVAIKNEVLIQIDKEAAATMAGITERIVARFQVLKQELHQMVRRELDAHDREQARGSSSEGASLGQI